MCACEAKDTATAKQKKSGTREGGCNGFALATLWRQSASALMHARESVLDNAKAKLLHSRFAQGRRAKAAPCSSAVGSYRSGSKQYA